MTEPITEYLPIKPEPNPKLTELSRENIQRIKDNFIQESIQKGLFKNMNQAEEQITQQTEAVKKSFALTINLSPESIERLLETGQQDTFWEHLAETGSIEKFDQSTNQNKSIGNDYLGIRKTAEEQIVQFAPQQISTRINPSYASVVGGKVEDLTHGGSPEYGNYFLFLDRQLSQYTVYNLADSFANVSFHTDDHGGKGFTFDTKHLLEFQDVFQAKAMINLAREYNQQFGRIGNNLIDLETLDELITIDGVRSGYIEAIIFEKIFLENIDAIGVTIAEPNQLVKFSQILKKYPQHIGKFSLFVDPNKIGITATEWLTKNMPKKVQFIKPLENTEAPNFLQEIKPESNFESIAITISQREEKIKKILQRRFVIDRHQTLSLGLAEKLLRDQKSGRLHQEIDTETLQEFVQIETAKCLFN